MSEENVELARSLLQDLADRAEGWSSRLSEDVVPIEAREFPGTGVHRGREAAVAAVADAGRAKL